MTVLPFPCDPWGGLSRLNLARGEPAATTVQEKRIVHQPLLNFVVGSGVS